MSIVWFHMYLTTVFIICKIHRKPECFSLVIPNGLYIYTIATNSHKKIWQKGLTLFAATPQCIKLASSCVL